MSYYSQNLNNKEKEIKINTLYQLFKKTLKKPIHKHTIDEIDYILKNKYLAKEIIDDNYLGLDNDPMVNAKDIVKMYRIDDPTIMENLYTEEEKKENKEIEDFNNPNIFVNYCNIILESTDGKYVSGYTRQGISIRLDALLFVLVSDVKEEDCNINDSWFQEYLFALELAGYINENF